CRVGSHQQRVAVGTGARDLLGAEAAERTGAVLDHNRLPERVLKVLSDQAGDLVRARAGGKRHDDPDLALGIVFGEAVADPERLKEYTDDGRPQHRVLPHGFVRLNRPNCAAQEPDYRPSPPGLPHSICPYKLTG